MSSELSTPTRHVTRWQFFARAGLVVYWILLFVATHVPVPDDTEIEVSDKLLHVLGYGALAFLATLAMATPAAARHFGYLFGALAVYGVLDELLQTLVGRTGDVNDWLADLLGIALGLMLGLAARMLLLRENASRAAQ